jgi:rhodanese-related sulfurtransferase
MLPSPDEQIEIGVDQLHTIRETPSLDIRLIDCREQDEFYLCKIEGAELVPLSTFAQSAATWPREDERPYIVYCHHGMRSLQATQFLRAKGFLNTFSLAGGIEAWSLQIDPTVPRY